MAIGRLGGHLDWLDVLAPEITLRFQGKRGIRTGFGIMLTIMYVLTLGASAYIITMSYFKTDAPLVVVENIEEVENHKSMCLTEDSCLCCSSSKMRRSTHQQQMYQSTSRSL